GPHHAVVADFLVHPHGLQHVDVPIVDERLLEVEEAAADVAEVHVEDLLARAEPADDVVDLLSGLLQHLADGALTEIQSVVRALGDADEALEAVDRSEHGLDALIAAAARHARTLRMTGNLP